MTTNALKNLGNKESNDSKMGNIAKGEMSEGAKAAMAAIEKAEKEMQELKGQGYTFYESIDSCFNTAMKDGTAINFIANSYHTKDAAEIECLAEFVESGKLVKV